MTTEAVAPSSPPRPRTYWWLASIAAPVLGLVVYALCLFVPAAETLGWLILFVGTVVGLWMCLRSFRRREVLCLVSLLSGIPCGLSVAAALVLLLTSLFYGTGARHF